MRPERVAKVLNPLLKKRLAMYALAGATAGLAASAPDASAAIVYTSVKQFGEAPLGNLAVIPIDLNHDGIADFNLVGGVYYAFNSFSRTHIAYVYIGANNDGVAVSGSENFSPAAAALNFGEKVGPALGFAAPGRGGFTLAFLGARPRSIGTHGGNFYNQTNKFLGLKLELNGKTYYGWARVNVRRVFGQAIPGKDLLFEVVDFAYQDTANTPLRAGEGIPQAGVPVAQSDGGQAEFPTTLGLLAYGSDAIPAWRSGQ